MFMWVAVTLRQVFTIYTRLQAADYSKFKNGLSSFLK
jgi:hypothetical protein